MKNNLEIPEYIFSDKNYRHSLVQYEGDIIEDGTKNIDEVYITVLNEQYAIVSVEVDATRDEGDIRSILDLINKKYGENKNFSIIYMRNPEMYTLQEISSLEAAQVGFLQLGLPLNLTGNGVTVGVIDTGIDYLSEEFTDSDGKTRINRIWDQTIISESNISKDVPYGMVYNREQIDLAIQAKKQGKNPYDIVPSKDLNGHGTNMSGILAASGKNPNLKGVAPECEIIAIKLVEDISYKEFYDIKVPVFNITSLFSAIEYLREYAIRESKPMVIFIPLGTNSGNHKGNNILDEYIQSVLRNVGIVVVTGAGNEGEEDGHVSGNIRKKGDHDTITLFVSPDQKNLNIEVWVDLPNILSIAIISPSGEETGLIPAVLNIERSYTFIFEKTKISVYYYLPEEISADQLIRVYFSDIQPGIWKLRLTLENGEEGVYNAWLPQKGISKLGTRFSPSDPYGTVTSPGDSQLVVTVAAYNQNNNNLLGYSGSSFRSVEAFKGIDVAAGGVNTMTVGPNNEVSVINGTSLSAAVVAGACILLLQWGIVDNNYPYMYSQSIKTFLERGTIKRRGDVYPNPQWGYGIINFYRIFENMASR